MKNTILRYSDITEKSGYSDDAIRYRVNVGLWTKPIKLGCKAVGWPEYEVDILIAAYIAAKNNDQIRSLVRKLYTVRQLRSLIFFD